MLMSKLGTIHLNDFWKGLLMAVLGAVTGYIYTAIETGTFDFNKITLLAMAKAGAVAGLSYLLKNLITNSEGKVLKSEPKQPEDVE